MAKQNCTSCAASILCKSEDVENCECKSIQLSQDTLDFLKQSNHNCLCNSCLSKFERAVSFAKNNHNRQVEGIHYYIDEDKLVFTEVAHIQRGYCCEKGCRHCPFNVIASEMK